MPVKIQVLAKGDYTEVLVDNKFAYTSFLQPKFERENLRKLIELAQLDNVEVTDKERM